MNNLKWNDEYKIGIENIDEQHKEIFRRTSLAMESLMKDQEDGIRKVLEFLKAYVIDHFQAEEKFQISIDYPEKEKHAELHREFVDTVMSMIDEFDKSKDKKVASITVNTVLIDWLINHICVEDLKIAKYYKNLTY